MFLCKGSNLGSCRVFIFSPHFRYVESVDSQVSTIPITLSVINKSTIKICVNWFEELMKLGVEDYKILNILNTLERGKCVLKA